jgi:PPP family 3-phenylpropionic acid transporter
MDPRTSPTPTATAATRPNLRFALLQGAYFFMYCAINAFIANNLLAYGVGHGVVGAAIATGAVASALIQPPLGRLADRHAAVSPRRVLCALFTAGVALSLALLPVSDPMVATGIYVVLFVVGQTAQPFVNVLGLSLGTGVNFGLARSCGSLSYAIAAAIIGVLVAQLGLTAFDWTLALFFLLCDACLLLFPADCARAAGTTQGAVGQDAEGAEIVAQADDAARASRRDTCARDRSDAGEVDAPARKGGFARRYPLYLAALVAAFLILCGHNGIGIYLIDFVTDLGGDSRDLGFATAIAACMEIPFMANYQRIRQNVSCTSVLVFSGACFFLKSLATLLATSIPMLYAAQAMQALAYALFLPALVELAEKAVDPRDAVTAQALVTTAITISFAAASLAGAAIVGRMGSHATLVAIVAVSAAGALALAAMARRMGATLSRLRPPRLARPPLARPTGPRAAAPGVSATAPGVSATAPGVSPPVRARRASTLRPARPQARRRGRAGPRPRGARRCRRPRCG